MTALEPFVYHYYDVESKKHFPCFGLFFPEQGQATDDPSIITDPSYAEIRISDQASIQRAFGLWDKHFKKLVTYETRVPDEFWLILPINIKSDIELILRSYSITPERLIIIIAIANRFLSLRSPRRLFDTDEDSRDFNHQIAVFKNLVKKYRAARKDLFDIKKQVQSIKFSFLNKDETFLISDEYFIRGIMEAIDSEFPVNLSQHKLDTSERRFEHQLLRTEFFDLIVSGLYTLLIEENLYPAKLKQYPKALMDLISQLFAIIYPNYWPADRELSENSKVVQVRLRRFLN